MTSRGHGMLLDQQTNLSRTRILAGDSAAEILIDGDSSAVTEANWSRLVQPAKWHATCRSSKA